MTMVVYNQAGEVPSLSGSTNTAKAASTRKVTVMKIGRRMSLNHSGWESMNFFSIVVGAEVDFILVHEKESFPGAAPGETFKEK